jgi:hypothetical protein
MGPDYDKTKMYRECYAIEKATRYARMGASDFISYIRLVDFWLMIA